MPIPKPFKDQPKDRAVPVLSHEDYQALKVSVKKVGRILEPILIDHSGIVIDGYIRLQIAEELDIHCPCIVA